MHASRKTRRIRDTKGVPKISIVFVRVSRARLYFARHLSVAEIKDYLQSMQNTN